jgi:hypothetical protein
VRTYTLSGQECHEQINTTRRELTSYETNMEQINTISFITALVTLRELTNCKGKIECQEQINIISLIPAPANIIKLTCCQAKNAKRRIPLASLQLHYFQERTYILSCQE